MSDPISLRAKKLPEWIKLPSGWIEGRGLREFRWSGGNGSDCQAALMALLVIANHADPETAIARLTYDELCAMTTLSRAKLSCGLDVLERRALIEREPTGQSTFRLSSYDATAGWAKLPAKGLYSNGAVAAFSAFRLRQRAELDALKLYFLFASRRDRVSNMAMISYDKIEDYSGVSREHIKRALTILGANNLVHIEHVPSSLSGDGVASAYRLVHLHSRRHMGTIGRGLDAFDFQAFVPSSAE